MYAVSEKKPPVIDLTPPDPLHEFPQDVRELLAMLTYRRPHKSASERRFINRFIRPLEVQQDDFGNLYKIVGPEEPTMLWSSHTDTVHRMAGQQKIAVGAGCVSLGEKETLSNCLGADCTAGVWLMMEMIRANVPGVYVFHRGEEVGSLGSHWISKNPPSWFAKLKFAIALDRRGTTDIITHQLSSRCASEAFATSLSRAMPSLNYKAAHGMFTDTAEYTGLIAECSNLSVGYYNEHTMRELLDLDHLVELRDALIALDQSTLACERIPGSTEYFVDDEDGYWAGSGKTRRWVRYRPRSRYRLPAPSLTRTSITSTKVRENAWVVADFLEMQGYSWEDIQDYNLARWQADYAKGRAE